MVYRAAARQGGELLVALIGTVRGEESPRPGHPAVQVMVWVQVATPSHIVDRPESAPMMIGANHGAGIGIRLLPALCRSCR